jgi:hypothetical protein
VEKIPLKEVEALDIEFGKDKSPEEKLGNLQYLRELYHTTNKESKNDFKEFIALLN